MSYEYKDYFKKLNLNESGKVSADLNDIFNARDELNEVYDLAEEYKEFQLETLEIENGECKLLIDEAIHNYFHDDTETEMAVKDWFYDLRKQASKADEYEAKAKAFDRIKAYSDKAINGDIHSLLLAEGIIDVVEQYDINRLSESGELE